MNIIQARATPTEWIFSPALEKWAEIPFKMITDAFERSQVPYKVADKWDDRVVVQLEVEPPVNLFTNQTDVVWENGDCQVVIVKEKGRFHLLFRPRENFSYSEIPDMKFLALKLKMRVIPDVFVKVFGFPDFCEQLVESQDSFGFEVFPGFSKPGADVVDLLDKDRRNLYLLSQGRFESYSLPEDKLRRLTEELVLALDGMGCLTQRSMVRQRAEVGILEARAYRVNAFARLLALQGAPIALVNSDEVSGLPKVKQAPDIDSRIIKSNECIFSNLKPIEIIFNDLIIQVALNTKPYVGRNLAEAKHVLVLPSRHVEDCTQVQEAEFLLERQAVLNVRREMENLYPGDQSYVWREQGVKAGQMEPHIHTQVLLMNLSEIWQYYRSQIEEIMKPLPLVFAPSPQLRQGLENANWVHGHSDS